MTAPEVNYPPSVKVVSNYRGFVSERFSRHVNVIVRPRNVPSGMLDIANRLKDAALEIDPMAKGLATRDYMDDRDGDIHLPWKEIREILKNLPNNLKKAVQFIEADRKRMLKLGQPPELRVQWETSLRAKKDQIFHDDGIAHEHQTFGRLLTFYQGAPTIGLPIDSVQYKIKSRKRKKRLSSKPIEEAKPFQMRVGDIWRHAAGYSRYDDPLPTIGNVIPPFIHRPDRSDDIRMFMLGSS